jgi:metal-responsive CopG/Arc/MetJ family transcriptional regulator
MRTTVRIDDDLMRELKARARRESISISELLNRAIRRGLVEIKTKRPVVAHQEKVFSMGEAFFDVNKASAFAAQLEDDETLRTLTERR